MKAKASATITAPASIMIEAERGPGLQSDQAAIVVLQRTECEKDGRSKETERP